MIVVFLIPFFIVLFLSADDLSLWFVLPSIIVGQVFVLSDLIICSTSLQALYLVSVVVDVRLLLLFIIIHRSAGLLCFVCLYPSLEVCSVVFLYLFYLWFVFFVCSDNIVNFHTWLVALQTA
jgi:hypothetical protein